MFRQLTDAEIEPYLRAEQPYDCAGSAKSEGLGIALLEAIDSDDPTALIGLPLIRTCRMLRAAGVDAAVMHRHACYLVPAPLDFGCDEQAPLQDALPLGTLQAAARASTHWICENAKSARAYLKRIDAIVPLAAPLQALHIDELPREVHKKGDHRRASSTPRPLLARRAGRPRHRPAERSRHAGGGRPGLVGGARGARRWASRWCRWSARCRCCWRWPPAA